MFRTFMMSTCTVHFRLVGIAIGELASGFLKTVLDSELKVAKIPKIGREIGQNPACGARFLKSAKESGRTPGCGS